MGPSDTTTKKVTVLMSGGVDSSTAALLLKLAGYEVTGVTGWLIKSGSRCCDTGMIDAARVAQKLEIDYHSVDLRELFAEQVIKQFHESYAVGRTPFPCSLCNTLVKWGALLTFSREELGADLIATGHYARVVSTGAGTALARARDQKKDQSYALWGLTNEQLQKTLLPLGEYTKAEIRQIARDHDLPTANRSESQDLCFIPFGQSPQDYLAKFLAGKPGPLIHADTGESLGEHKGTHNYTIGQRRGINLAWPEPLYVTRVEPDTGTVYVGPKRALLRSELTASQINWPGAERHEKPFKALVKIRYNSPAVPATVSPASGAAVSVIFDEPQPAVTPGQVMAAYDLTNTFLICGGWID